MGNDAIKDAGTTALAVGAGIGTGAIAGVAGTILSGKISNNIVKSMDKEAIACNSVFKAPALKAFENEKIFHVDANKLINEIYNLNLNSKTDESFIKKGKAFSMITGSYKDADLASRINRKIDGQINKLLMKITKIMPSLSKVGDNVPNPMKDLGAREDFVFADINKHSVAAFHEMGHVKNYQSKGLGKVLGALRHPLVKKIALATAFLGIILPPTKNNDEGSKDNSLTQKAGMFLKDNCVAISAVATVPTVLEEGLASLEGAKIASKVMPPDKLKIVNKLNAKAGLTYLIGATIIPLGVYVANKVRNALA